MPPGEPSPRNELPARGSWTAAGSLLLLFLGACAGGPDPASDLAAIAPGSAADTAGGASEPLWGALRAALADQDDELAGVLLERLRPRALTVEERERLAAFERVLAGRRLGRSVALRLVSEPSGVPGEHRIVLLVRSAAAFPVELRLPPARLTSVRSAVSPDGSVTRALRSRNVDVFAELECPPGRTTRHVLAEEEIPLGGALAVRERWSLQPLSGEWETPDGLLPASRIEVASCERVRLARELPLAPVPLAELLRYAREATIRTPPLLERAVRLPSPQHARALEALAPLVRAWVRDDPARVEALAPALRWLSGASLGGLQPAEWAALLEQASRPAERPRLDVGEPAQERR